MRATGKLRGFGPRICLDCQLGLGVACLQCLRWGQSRLCLQCKQIKDLDELTASRFQIVSDELNTVMKDAAQDGPEQSVESAESFDSPQAEATVKLAILEDAVDSLKALTKDAWRELEKDLFDKHHAVQKKISGLRQDVSDLESRMLEKIDAEISVVMADVHPEQADDDMGSSPATPPDDETMFSGAASEDVEPDCRNDDLEKRGSWFVPRKPGLPCIFGAICVRVRLTGTEQQVSNFTESQIEDVVASGLRLPGILGWTSEIHDVGRPSSAQDTLVFLREAPVELMASEEPLCAKVGDVMGTVLEVVDTANDGDAARQQMVQASLGDSLAVSLPQSWVIPNPDFVPDAGCVPLFPGSIWYSFFQTWGAVHTAQLVFASSTDRSTERPVDLVVQFRERDSLARSFACLWDRFLKHPEKLDLRFVQCRLVDIGYLSSRTQ